MARIVIAGASEAIRARFSRLLAASGFTVFRCCASGGELRRAINACGACVVLLLGSFPDCKPDDLQADFGACAQFLLIGKPAQLTACESAQIFRLALPVSGQTVIAALEGLISHAPRRSAAENMQVERAKALLMQKHGMTEPEAHHALQQYAMRRGKKLAEYAASILNTTERKEDR